MPITTVKIFPSIGVARLGNSPESFVGPEIPGDRTPPPDGYRDSHCRIKRQAARFRLFGFDGSTCRSSRRLTQRSSGRSISPTRKPRGAGSWDSATTGPCATPRRRTAPAWKSIRAPAR